MTAAQTMDQYRGQKNVIQNVTSRLGETGTVYDRTRSGQNEYLNSGMLIEVQIVRASATIVAPAGKCLSYKTGSLGTLVDVITGSGEIADGICDHDLVGDLASGDTFLLFRKGPMNVIASDAISADARLKTAAAGKVVTAATEMTPDSRGRIMVSAAADGDIRLALMDFTIP